VAGACDESADRLHEPGGIREVADHEAGKSLRRVQLRVLARRADGHEIEAAGGETPRKPRAVGGSRDDEGCILRLDRPAEKVGHRVEQEVVAVIELNEVAALPRGEAADGRRGAVPRNGGGPGEHAPHEVFEVLVADAHCTMAEARRGKLPGADPPPDAHAAHIEKLRRLRNAVIRALLAEGPACFR